MHHRNLKSKYTNVSDCSFKPSSVNFFILLDPINSPLPTFFYHTP